MKLVIYEKVDNGFFDSTAYDEYLDKHIGGVKKCYDILVKHGIFKDDFSTSKQIEAHDKSKYSDEEYDAYGRYFYGDKKNVSHCEDKDFKYAWLHHQHNNPHHWQYWLLKEDESDKLEALDMPEEYIEEMICDWMSFSYSKKDINELFKWYSNNKDKQVLSDKTRKTVEKYLDKIKSANIDLTQE